MNSGRLCERNRTTIRLDVFYRDATLLIDAVYLEKYEIAKYLIEIGTDLTMTDDVGRDLFQIAALTNYGDEIINLLD